MRKSRAHILHLLALASALAACNPTKRVPQGEHLLVKNTIDTDTKDLTSSELAAILKQKPNKKVLGQRIYLHIYNLSDPVKTERIKQRSDSLCAVKNAERAKKAEAKNERRRAKGKEEKPFVEKPCKKTRRVWAREDVGEAPVILDTTLVARSVEQLELYLDKEGYYRGVVDDTIYFNRTKLFSKERGRPFKQPKAEVEYRIRAGRPYTLCTWTWRVNDPSIDSLVRASMGASLLVPGMRLDSDVLDKERTRISDLMRQQGYLFFTRDLVQYDADTSAGDREVDLVLHIERPLTRGDKGLKGTPEGSVYAIEDVIIDISGRPLIGNVKRSPPDTTTYRDYIFLFRGERPAYRPKALLNSVLVKPGTRFSQATNDRTYRRLTNLRVFDRVDITYDTSATQQPFTADCRINLLPSKRQNFSAEGFGTNRGGFLGTSISLNYRHKNLFRSMGSVQAQMTMGLEAQQSLSGQNGGADDASLAVGRDVLFNTIEFGPEVTVRFPRFLLPFVHTDSWVKTWGQRTAVSILYNYQRRPDYTRTLAKVSFGYEWNKSRTRTWGVFPVEFNIIRIPELSNAFLDFIQTANDAVLRDSYTDHVVAGARVVYTLNTQDPNVRKRNVFFWRPVLQTSGHLLQLANQVLGLEQRTDTAGNSFYTMAGVRFAQFIKLENDLRYYHTIHEKSSLAFRLFGGVGVPFGNLDVLPFETSFFGGGANGMRAWRARSLGPGSYSAPLNAFDRIGEVRIEGNAEYRFKLIGYLEGALFCDIGNIWDLHPNPAKPGGAFNVGDFASELAFGTGVGIRLNFDFFLVRFDLGLQTKDPSLPMGQRWIFEPKGPEHVTTLGQKLNFNLGIGYPF